MKPNYSLMVVSLWTLLACPSTQADLYSWKDSNGKTIFSDRPPLNSEQKIATEAKSKNSKNATPDDKSEDPRNALRRDEAKKKKIQEDDRKLIKWRCNELDKEYRSLLTQYDNLLKTDTKKAELLKVSAANHKDTLEKLCN